MNMSHHSNKPNAGTRREKSSTLFHILTGRFWPIALLSQDTLPKVSKGFNSTFFGLQSHHCIHEYYCCRVTSLTYDRDITARCAARIRLNTPRGNCADVCPRGPCRPPCQRFIPVEDGLPYICLQVIPYLMTFWKYGV